ncbi:hypothetical protein KYE_01206 [Marinobacter manganoxydans MnI7-9]|uniref:Uncharacterized protein n=1 Tax=Marinobacter manganoxydans MnI7-9 TaxID=1094979 RepID=G6YN40_9GAMM|nr:hypothetical protein KYE_01206 [Marinobacter manganoxydans MnI7-9]MAK50703.1 hypothetical protein [Marinobacter sp.]
MIHSITSLFLYSGRGRAAGIFVREVVYSACLLGTLAVVTQIIVGKTTSQFTPLSVRSMLHIYVENLYMELALLKIRV